MPDPIPLRSGILYGASDEVLAPEIAPELRRSASSAYSDHAGGTQAPGEPGVGYEGFCQRIGDHAGGDGFFRPIKSAVAAYIARHGSQVDTSWLRSDLEVIIRRAARDAAKHPDDYIELRVDDLDPLIAAVVDMERESEEAEERKTNNNNVNAVSLDRQSSLAEFTAPAFAAPITEQAYDNFLTMVFTRFADAAVGFRSRMAEWTEAIKASNK
jgi:hypothetical protein